MKLLSVSNKAAPFVDELGKERLVRTLRGLLGASMNLRNDGAAYARLAHSQGYADGFMRCLVESKVLTERELLEIVQDVRRGVDGPGSAEVARPDASSARIVAA